jgi:hypothetical protein
MIRYYIGFFIAGTFFGFQLAQVIYARKRRSSDDYGSE